MKLVTNIRYNSVLFVPKKLTWFSSYQTWNVSSSCRCTNALHRSTDVPVELWNSSITLDFPCHSPQSLLKLCSLVQRRQIVCMYSELRLNLRGKFGSDWLQALESARKQQQGRGLHSSSFSQSLILNVNRAYECLHWWSATSWFKWESWSALMF